MTPYARSLLIYLSLPLLLGIVGQSNKLYRDLAISPELFWAAVVAMAVGVFIVHYWKATGDLRDQAGFYARVRRVKAAAARTFENLGVKKYLPLYCERPEDKTIRDQLKAKNGALITGVPLGGKTRTALEAIAATWPDAFLLRVDPDNLSVDKVGRFIVPALFVFFRKPAVVVFLDKIDALLEAKQEGAIDKLLNRLSDQTSAVYVVATCDEGRVEDRLKTLRESPRGYMFEPIRLTTISGEIADRIYTATWKGVHQPLLLDRSQPGYVVFGNSPSSGRVAGLAEVDRKMVRALQLAAVCGSADCGEALLWGILENVFGLKVDRNETLARLSSQYVLAVQGKAPHRKISAQHQIYLDEAYDSAEAFKIDLARLADWLAVKGDWRSLSAVGAYQWIALRDFAAARKAYDAVAALADTGAEQLVHCSAFYLAIGEQKAREETLSRALNLVPAPRDKARLLVGLGDIYLYRLRTPHEAMKTYNDAYHAIEKKDGAEERELVDLIRRRSGDTYLVGREYANALPYFQGWYSVAQGDDRLDAAERVALAAVGAGEDATARAALSDAWKGLDAATRTNRTLKFLDSAEGCLVGDRLNAAGDLAASFSLQPKSVDKAKAIEVVDFGYAAVTSGFVRLSKAVHAHLCGMPDAALEIADRINVHINLGFSLSLLGDQAAAKQAYEKARTLGAADPQAQVWGSGAESGLGDVALRTGNVAAAKEHYRRALAAIGATRHENLSNWAHMGLGDVAIAERDFDEADRQFAQIAVMADSYAQHVRLWLGLARVRMHEKRWADAESFLKRGLTLNPRSDFPNAPAEFQKLLEEVERNKGYAPA